MKKFILILLLLIVVFLSFPVYAISADGIKGKAINIFQIVLEVMGAAAIIVKLTPTKRDDKIFGKVNKFLRGLGNFFVLNIGK